MFFMRHCYVLMVVIPDLVSNGFSYLDGLIDGDWVHGMVLYVYSFELGQRCYAWIFQQRGEII